MVIGGGPLRRKERRHDLDGGATQMKGRGSGVLLTRPTGNGTFTPHFTKPHSNHDQTRHVPPLPLVKANECQEGPTRGTVGKLTQRPSPSTTHLSQLHLILFFHCPRHSSEQS